MERIFYLKFFCLIFLTTSIPISKAQDRQVRGKVVDLQNLSLPRVSVSIKGEKPIALTGINDYNKNFSGIGR